MKFGKITVEKLLIKSHIGVGELERSELQELLCTVQLNVDFSRCIESDQISDTINYVDLVRKITDFAKENRCCLLECFAVDLARYLIGIYGANEVKVVISKSIIHFNFLATVEWIESR